MKKLFARFVCVLFVLIGVIKCPAQTNTIVDNPLWMVSSKSALRSYLFDQVRRASASMYSVGQVDDFSEWSAYSTRWVWSGSGTGVVASLNRTSLGLMVVNPTNDYVGVSAYLYPDKNGSEPYFYAYNYGKMVDPGHGGIWKLEDKFFNLSFNLCWRVRISITGGVPISAKALIRNESGDVVETRYFEIQDGQIWLETDVVGRDGELIVTAYDASLPMYRTIIGRLSDNGKPNATFVMGILATEVDGFKSYPDNQPVLVDNKYYDGGYHSGLKKVRYTREMRVILKADSGNGMRPYGYFIRDMQNPGNPIKYIEWESESMDFWWDATPGSYDIWFNWGNDLVEPRG